MTQPLISAPGGVQSPGQGFRDPHDLCTFIQRNLNNLVIHLPPSHLIVEREPYEQLKQEATQGRYMTLGDVLELLNVSRPWLLDNVLYKPSIRKEIDIDQNPDGFVKYPTNQGGRYFFLASKAKAYFEQHFKDIFS